MEKIDEIIKTLKEEFAVKAAILVGSRAVGDFDPESDWDMYVFSEEVQPGESSKDFTERKGVPDIPGAYIQAVFLPLNTNFHGISLD